MSCAMSPTCRIGPRFSAYIVDITNDFHLIVS